MKEVKTEVEGIFRDTTNGALLNKDNMSLQAYKKIKQKNHEQEEMKQKVNKIESDISDIKSVLNILVEKLQ
jgi:hypothetical protein